MPACRAAWAPKLKLKHIVFVKVRFVQADQSWKSWIAKFKRVKLYRRSKMPPGTFWNIDFQFTISALFQMLGPLKLSTIWTSLSSKKSLATVSREGKEGNWLSPSNLIPLKVVSPVSILSAFAAQQIIGKGRNLASTLKFKFTNTLLLTFFCHAISVTRWLDYFLSCWSFTTMKFAQ